MLLVRSHPFLRHEATHLWPHLPPNLVCRQPVLQRSNVQTRSTPHALIAPAPSGLGPLVSPPARVLAVALSLATRPPRAPVCARVRPPAPAIPRLPIFRRAICSRSSRARRDRPRSPRRRRRPPPPPPPRRRPPPPPTPARSCPQTAARHPAPPLPAAPSARAPTAAAAPPRWRRPPSRPPPSQPPSPSPARPSNSPALSSPA
mmetsp:Transcript_44732/g.124064  ORF Transcript_44732/g.124064 Transcript_44732/m.124064 type:complete len:203 (+) Transcript_44732:174-782(+)